MIQTHSVVCNVCHSDDATILYPAGVAQIQQIVQCNRCGLMYANPRKTPDCEEMKDYPDDPNWDMSKENPQRFEKEKLQVRDYAETRAELNALYPNRGKIVEIGSSMGFLLDSFRKDGWDVLGIDPDRNGCRYASEKNGIPTRVGTLEEARLPDASFDVVLMMHVIEHVPDPAQLLTEIRRILVPGGRLVMETPRYDTLMYKILGRRERSLGCEGHIYFFTNDSLRRIYEAAGFTLEQHDNVGRSMTLDRLMFNVGVVSRSTGFQKFLNNVSRRLGFNNVTLSLNLRDMQRVRIRKDALPGAKSSQ
jgi:SAM-dependent methyltransferase